MQFFCDCQDRKKIEILHTGHARVAKGSISFSWTSARRVVRKVGTSALTPREPAAHRFRVFSVHERSCGAEFFRRSEEIPRMSMEKKKIKNYHLGVRELAAGKKYFYFVSYSGTRANDVCARGVIRRVAVYEYIITLYPRTRFIPLVLRLVFSRPTESRRGYELSFIFDL